MRKPHAVYRPLPSRCNHPLALSPIRIRVGRSKYRDHRGAASFVSAALLATHSRHDMAPQGRTSIVYRVAAPTGRARVTSLRDIRQGDEAVVSCTCLRFDLILYRQCYIFSSSVGSVRTVYGGIATKSYVTV